MNLPDYIIEEIAARRVVFFLGAGASAASLSADGRRHPPDWPTLLARISRLVTNRTVKKVAREFVGRQDFLGAAEVLLDAVHEPDFHTMMVNEIQRPDYQGNPLVRAVHDLDPKIVVSTNYDLIYEGVCSEEIRTGLMQTKTYRDNGIIDVIRSSARLIVYAHGSIRRQDEIVLSTSQYYQARRSYPGFFSVMESLFVMNTVLFLGYSLRDPDIQLILESNSLKARSSRRHLILLEAGLPSAVVKAMESKFDLKVLTYPKGKHDAVHRCLADILPDVEMKRSVGI